MKDFPDIAIHGTEQTAPAAGTVLADSGAMNAGRWAVLIQVGTTDTANNLFQIAHRNAANNADVELADVGNTGVDFTGFFTLLANERIVVRNKNVGTAALFYQANLYCFSVTSG